jgi:hypothetical protein
VSEAARSLSAIVTSIGDEAAVGRRPFAASAKTQAGREAWKQGQQQQQQRKIAEREVASGAKAYQQEQKRRLQCRSCGDAAE